MKQRNLLITAFIVVLLILGGGFFLYKQYKSRVMIDEFPLASQEISSEKSGTVLAGKSSPYLEFSQADYDKALESGKIIFLDFYANWCPICRGEAPELEAGFDALTTDKIVGFRVNYNDSDTDAVEKNLAKQFAVSYQHTKVILKNGTVVLKDGEVWDKERFLEELNKVIQ